MTKIERDLLEIINSRPWGLTSAEIVGFYVEKHLGPALLKLQDRKRKVVVFNSSLGPRLAPYIKKEKFL